MNKLEISNVEEVVNLSPQQLGMLLVYLRDKESKINLEQISLGLKGIVDEELIKNVWDSIIYRHPVLRAVFRWEGIKLPLQIILKKTKNYIQFIDLNFLKEEEIYKKICEIKEKDANEQFKLDEGVIRITCIKSADKLATILITMHHIVCDGWSTSVIIQEFLKLYNNEISIDKFIMIKDNYYKKYLHYIKTIDESKHKLFWHNYLYVDNTSNSVLRECNISKSDICDTCFIIEGSIMSNMQKCIKKNKLTLANLLFYCWGETLKKLYDYGEVGFNITTSTRVNIIKNENFNTSVGLYINTIPIRFNEDETNVWENVKEFCEQLKECLKHAYLSIPNYQMQNNLINSLVVVENYPIEEIFKLNKDKLSITNFEVKQNSGYDITFIIMPYEELKIMISYKSCIFTEYDIGKIYKVFKSILINIIEDNDIYNSIDRDYLFNLRQSLKRKNNKKHSDFPCLTDTNFQSDTELIIRDIWSEILQIDKKKIHRESDFFELSGHSLDTIYMVNRIESLFNVRVDVGKVYELSKLNKLAQFVKYAQKNRQITIKKSLIKEKYLASSEQKRMYILNELNYGSIQYNVSSAYIINGEVDKEKFSSIFDTIIKRHEALRTSFCEYEDSIYQIIHEDVGFELQYEEAKDADELLIEKIINQFIEYFDLKKDLLIRVKLVKLSIEKYILIVDMHHIVSDGVSTGILIKEFLKLYHNEKLDIQQYQYKDYSEWQNSQEYELLMQDKKNFWLNEFKNETNFPHLPYDFCKNDIPEDKGKQIYFSIDKVSVVQLKNIALSKHTSLFCVLLSLYYIMVYKISKEKQIVVGTPVANRTNYVFENIFGVFVNTLPIRMEINEKECFGDFLVRLSKKWNKALNNQDYQLDKLYEELAKQKGTKVHLFDVCFLLQNMRIPPVKLLNFEMREYSFKNNTTKFDLIFIGTEEKNEINFEVVYRCKVFREETIENYISYYKEFILKILNNKTINIESMLQSHKFFDGNTFATILE